jgi:hypothetical protein
MLGPRPGVKPLPQHALEVLPSRLGVTTLEVLTHEVNPGLEEIEGRVQLLNGGQVRAHGRAIFTVADPPCKSQPDVGAPRAEDPGRMPSTAHGTTITTSVSSRPIRVTTPELPAALAGRLHA